MAKGMKNKQLRLFAEMWWCIRIDSTLGFHAEDLHAKESCKS